MRPSMGNTGICWDNAMAESFFAALKNELVHRTAFPTIDHVKKAVAFYIEVFYNRERLHSATRPHMKSIRPTEPHQK